jgi:hypothetical protein
MPAVLRQMDRFSWKLPDIFESPQQRGDIFVIPNGRSCKLDALHSRAWQKMETGTRVCATALWRKPLMQPRFFWFSFKYCEHCACTATG